MQPTEVTGRGPLVGGTVLSTLYFKVKIRASSLPARIQTHLRATKQDEDFEKGQNAGAPRVIGSHLSHLLHHHQQCVHITARLALILLTAASEATPAEPSRCDSCENVQSVILKRGSSPFVQFQTDETAGKPLVCGGGG